MTAPLSIELLYREESGRIVATLIRLLGDFDLAEEVAQEAFAAAITQWNEGAVPDQPRAWIVSTARHKALDAIRRRAILSKKQREIAVMAAIEERVAPAADDASAMDVVDDTLRLIFTCCHPAFSHEAQIALTLKTLCGMSTEEIARAFLVSPVTMAQRIVRAKSKFRAAGIPYRVPGPSELPERLEAVMTVVYLVFNEGYAATAGDAIVRRELCAEAIRLARWLVELLPAEGRPRALLALLLLHDARRDARTRGGEIVLLEEQDRSLWDGAQIAEGLVLVEAALRAERPSAYALQAAIAALHARAKRAEETDWRQIAALYELLAHLSPSPVVELNRAVAVAMVDGPERGLRLLDALAARAVLDDYHLLHAARADLLRRLGRFEEASAAYRAALALVSNDAERRFIERRLAEVTGPLRPSERC